MEIPQFLPSMDDVWQVHCRDSLSVFKALMIEKKSDLDNVKSEVKKKNKNKSNIRRFKGATYTDQLPFATGIWTSNKRLFASLYACTVGMEIEDMIAGMTRDFMQKINLSSMNFLQKKTELLPCDCIYCNTNPKLTIDAHHVARQLLENFTGNKEALALFKVDQVVTDGVTDEEGQQQEVSYEQYEYLEEEEEVGERGEDMSFESQGGENSGDVPLAVSLEIRVDVPLAIDQEIIVDDVPLAVQQGNVDDLVMDISQENVVDEPVVIDDEVVTVGGRLVVGAILYHNGMACASSLVAVDGSLTRNTDNVNPILVCLYTDNGGRFVYTAHIRPWCSIDGYGQHRRDMKTAIARLQNYLVGRGVPVWACVSDHGENYVGMTGIARVNCIPHLINRLIFVLSASDANEQSFLYDEGDGAPTMIDINGLKKECINGNVYPANNANARRARNLWQHLTATSAENSNYAILQKYGQNTLLHFLNVFTAEEVGLPGTNANNNWNKLCIVAEMLANLSSVQDLMEQTMNGNIRQVLVEAVNFFERVTIVTAGRQDGGLVRELVASIRIAIATYDGYRNQHPNVDFRVLDFSLEYHYGLAESCKTGNSRNITHGMNIIDALCLEPFIELPGTSFYSNQTQFVFRRPPFLDIEYIHVDNVFVPAVGVPVNQVLRDNYLPQSFIGFAVEDISAALQTVGYVLNSADPIFYRHDNGDVVRLVSGLARYTYNV